MKNLAEIVAMARREALADLRQMVEEEYACPRERCDQVPAWYVLETMDMCRVKLLNRYADEWAAQSLDK
jgi:hypothetical protein